MKLLNSGQYHSVIPRPGLVMPPILWCIKNFGLQAEGRWKWDRNRHGLVEFKFYESKDALLFKMVWG